MTTETEISAFVERTAGEVVESLANVDQRLAIRILQNALFFVIRRSLGGSFPAGVTMITEWAIALAMREKNGEYVGGTQATLQ